MKLYGNCIRRDQCLKAKDYTQDYKDGYCELLKDRGWSEYIKYYFRINYKTKKIYMADNSRILEITLKDFLWQHKTYGLKLTFYNLQDEIIWKLFVEGNDTNPPFTMGRCV